MNFERSSAATTQNAPEAAVPETATSIGINAGSAHDGPPLSQPYSARPLARPPGWLILSTGALAITCLALSVAETSLWAHYMIGGGEFLSIFGLGFILIAGLYLHRRQSLLISLPLVFPWLLYPVITQGDQIIDNLSINWMRLICQVLLAAIFVTPVAVLVLGARYAFGPRWDSRTAPHLARCIPGLQWLMEGRTREGTGVLAASLLVAEIWIAHQFLGSLMVITLIVLVFGTLIYTSLGQTRPLRQFASAASGERFALVVLLGGVALSCGLYLGFKNRPGAYQGSPSAFMNPRHQAVAYPLGKIPVSIQEPQTPISAEAIHKVFIDYSRTIETLFAGYRVLDRNYTYDFHNHLFLKNTPLITNYRAMGLGKIKEARLLWTAADAEAFLVRPALGAGDPVAVLLDEVRAYLDYNFKRAPVLETMSGEFEKTEAGLQHAAHLYEGECKAFGGNLAAILKKHHQVIESSATAPITSEFALTGRSIYETYAHHVVGF